MGLAVGIAGGLPVGIAEGLVCGAVMGTFQRRVVGHLCPVRTISLLCVTATSCFVNVTVHPVSQSSGTDSRACLTEGKTCAWRAFEGMDGIWRVSMCVL